MNSLTTPEQRALADNEARLACVVSGYGVGTVLVGLAGLELVLFDGEVKDVAPKALIAVAISVITEVYRRNTRPEVTSQP